MDLHGDGLSIEKGGENNKPTTAIAKKKQQEREKKKTNYMEIPARETFEYAPRASSWSVKEWTE